MPSAGYGAAGHRSGKLSQPAAPVACQPTSHDKRPGHAREQRLQSDLAAKEALRRSAPLTMDD
eukprot:11784558-Prorocentrum_lima.AAC.1